MPRVMYATLSLTLAFGAGVATAQTERNTTAKRLIMSGIVKTATATSLTIEHSGHAITVAVTPSTRFIGRGARPSDLVLRSPGPTVANFVKPGDRVTITYRQSDGAMNAVEVRVVRRQL
jgi:hypothetical protein